EELLSGVVGVVAGLDLPALRRLLVHPHAGLDVVFAASVQLGRCDQAVERPVGRVPEGDLAFESRVPEVFPGGRRWIDELAVVHEPDRRGGEENTRVLRPAVAGEDLAQMGDDLGIERLPYPGNGALRGGVDVEVSEVD